MKENSLIELGVGDWNASSLSSTPALGSFLEENVHLSLVVRKPVFRVSDQV